MGEGFPHSEGFRLRSWRSSDSSSLPPLPLPCPSRGHFDSPTFVSFVRALSVPTSSDACASPELCIGGHGRSAGCPPNPFPPATPFPSSLCASGVQWRALLRAYPAPPVPARRRTPPPWAGGPGRSATTLRGYGWGLTRRARVPSESVAVFSLAVPAALERFSRGREKRFFFGRAADGAFFVGGALLPYTCAASGCASGFGCWSPDH